MCAYLLCVYSERVSREVGEWGKERRRRGDALCKISSGREICSNSVFQPSSRW